MKQKILKFIVKFLYACMWYFIGHVSIWLIICLFYLKWVSFIPLENNLSIDSFIRILMVLWVGISWWLSSIAIEHIIKQNKKPPPSPSDADEFGLMPANNPAPMPDCRPPRNVPIDNKGSCNPKIVGGYQPHKTDKEPIPPGDE